MTHDEIITKNQEYFGNQWANFSKLSCFSKQNFVEHLLRCTNSVPEDWKDKSVFEGGGGVGRNIIGASKLGANRITATELSEEGVSAIIYNAYQSQVEVDNIYQADLCLLDKEKDNTYDVVFSINCLPHIPDYKKALSEMIRICKPNGLVMFNVPPQRPKLIAEIDNKIREYTTKMCPDCLKLFSEIMTYWANKSEISSVLKDKMELSGDVLSAYDHFGLPYTSEFTQEQIRKDMNDLNCEVLAINNLISVKARKNR
jgi:ubiquinone/menaquinone biosynthesis C-methylase UbiE